MKWVQHVQTDLACCQEFNGNHSLNVCHNLEHLASCKTSEVQHINQGPHKHVRLKQHPEEGNLPSTHDLLLLPMSRCYHRMPGGTGPCQVQQDFTSSALSGRPPGTAIQVDAGLAFHLVLGHQGRRCAVRNHEA